MSELLVTNIGMLATPLGSAARKGPEQGQIQVLKDAWVLIRDERVAQVRKYLELIRTGGFKFPDAEERNEGSVAFATVREPVFGRENMKGF